MIMSLVYIPVRSQAFFPWLAQLRDTPADLLLAT